MLTFKKRKYLFIFLLPYFCTLAAIHTQNSCFFSPPDVHSSFQHNTNTALALSFTALICINNAHSSYSHTHRERLIEEIKKDRGRQRRERGEIDRADLQPLSCPQKGCLFRGNDTCCRGGNDLLGPRVRSSLAPRPLHSALFLSSNTTRACMHAPSPHPSHLLFLLHHPFLPFIFSALHPSLVCHGRSAANPSRVGAGRAVRACVGVCVDVCVNDWICESESCLRCCGPQRRPNCARVHLVFACKLLYTNTHIHTRFLALSPLINSVTGACVFVHDTTEVHQPCLPRALLTDCWTIAGYKGAHHAGIQTYDEISNHVVEECVCVGACLHTHTHSCTPNRTVAVFNWRSPTESLWSAGSNKAALQTACCFIYIIHLL